MSVHALSLIARMSCVLSMPAGALAVVVVKPDASDAWMLAGVILSTLPTVADIGRNRAGRLVSKLSGTLVMGMLLPLIGYHGCQEQAIVQELSRYGWTWLGAGFLSGLAGWQVARMILSALLKRAARVAGTDSAVSDSDPFK